MRGKVGSNMNSILWSTRSVCKGPKQLPADKESKAMCLLEKLKRAYENAELQNHHHMAEVCSRLAYVLDLGMEIDCTRLDDVTPGSDRYKHIYLLTDTPEFYRWRSFDEYWSDKFE